MHSTDRESERRSTDRAFMRSYSYGNIIYVIRYILRPDGRAPVISAHNMDGCIDITLIRERS